MPSRPFDASRARCDVCGRAYQDGDAVYALADKFDESVEDRDVLVAFRHWNCHTPVSVQLEKMRRSVDDASRRAHTVLDELRRKL